MELGAFSYAYWSFEDLFWGSVFLSPFPVFPLGHLPFSCWSVGVFTCSGYEPLDICCSYQVPGCSLPHILMSCDEQKSIWMNSNLTIFSCMVTPFGVCLINISLLQCLVFWWITCIQGLFPSVSMLFTLRATKLMFCLFTTAQLSSLISWKFRIEMSFLKSFGSQHLKNHLAHWPEKFYLRQMPRTFFASHQLALTWLT